MSKKKQSVQLTMQLILDILSFDSSDVFLKQQLNTIEVDWDAIVIVASNHLVLPAVYCRLRQKSLLSYLPEDLNHYLQELTKLNRDRNQTLLQEVKDISKLFIEANIDYVCIKGMALLAGEYFKDLGERMIGDIDLLVASEDLDKAFNLLVSEGYTHSLPFNYKVKNFRHRPRQISENHLGAIELHDQLLKDGHNHLIDTNVLLAHKETTNGIAIPKPEHLILNTILAQQINDHSYNYNILKLKGVYDVMAVGLPQKKEWIGNLSKEKYSLAFLSLASVFCPNLSPTKESIVTHFKKGFFILKLNFPKCGNLIFKMTSLYLGIKERLYLLFFNKSYRHHVIKNKMIK